MQKCIHFFVLVPGPVRNLTVTTLSSTLLQVSWATPEVTNGAVQSYSVIVQRQTLAAVTVFSASVLPGLQTIVVSGLSKW